MVNRRSADTLADGWALSVCRSGGLSGELGFVLDVLSVWFSAEEDMDSS